MNSNTDSQTNMEILVRCIPWAKDTKKIVRLLEEMGVSDSDFTSIIRGDTRSIFGQIINPDDGEAYPIEYADVQLKSEEAGYSLLINKVPYKKYFEDLKKEIATISEAATGSEIISKLWEENKRLKRMLVLVGRAKF